MNTSGRKVQKRTSSNDFRNNLDNETTTCGKGPKNKMNKCGSNTEKEEANQKEEEK